MSQTSQTIFVLEDDPDINRLVGHQLERAGYGVRPYFAIGTIVEDAERARPSLFLLDVMVPGGDGMELCRRLRRHATLSSVPIIFLTARASENDRVRGLELGADDYITKPFGMRELLARVKAVLRRTSVVPKELDQHSFGDIEVDLRRCRVVKSGQALDVSSKEFELLKYFICHAGETLSRHQLLEDVWGYEHYPTTRTVDTHLVRLRQKLEPNPEQPQYFLTVHGTGYRFVG